MLAVGLHRLEEDLDRPVDQVREELWVALGVADHRAQGDERLLNQRQPEFVHGREVAVEGGGDDAGLARHVAQADLPEAVDLAQLQGGGEQGVARALLLLSAGGRGLGHVDSLNPLVSARPYTVCAASRSATLARVPLHQSYWVYTRSLNLKGRPMGILSAAL